MELSVQQSEVSWEKCWRIIPSRYPPIYLFERVASKEDFDVLYEIEGITNDRLRQEVGDLSLLPEEDRIYGEGSSFIMAAFTHLNPRGSRFSDGTWGVYYAARDIETAIAETKYHRKAFMSATNLPPMHLDMRVLVAKLNGLLHDIRGEEFKEAPIYDPSSYHSSQSLARDLKQLNSNGIAYWSVRNSDGQNVAIFRPKVLSNCIQERHLEYAWDGNEIANIFEKRML